MTAQMFAVDDRELGKLMKFYATAPRKFAKATGMMLNNFAFGTQYRINQLMPKRMTIRNKSFLKRQIRVDKARPVYPIQNQESSVFSVSAPRFSGWLEQETGKKTDRKRTIALGARGRNKKKQAKKRARFMTSNQFLNPDDMAGVRGDKKKAQVLLARVFREKYKKPFLLWGHDKLGPGLYVRKSKKKTRVLQRMDTKKVQPKRFRWMETSRNYYFAKLNLYREWAYIIDRVFKVKL